MYLKGIHLNKIRTKGKTDPYYRSKAWKQLRELKFQMNPLCEDCLEKGIVSETHTIDHIQPRKQGGADELWNLRSRCKKCNAIKTALDGTQGYGPLGRY